MRAAILSLEQAWPGTPLAVTIPAVRTDEIPAAGPAAVAWTPEVARLAREHNDANVLVLPARFLSEEAGVAILKAWLETE